MGQLKPGGRTRLGRGCSLRAGASVRRPMELMCLCLTASLPLGWAFAQRGASGSAGKAIYFLRDDAHEQWCGYADESRLKARVQPLHAMVVGRADYTDGRVSAVRLTEVDETGDWAVNDDYGLDARERIQSLKRTISILPEDTSEEQLFVIRDGRANRQRSTYRELSSGRPAQKHVDWFEPPPVVTSLQAFPFSALIARTQQAVWSKGEVCLSDSPELGTGRRRSGR